MKFLLKSTNFVFYYLLCLFINKIKYTFIFRENKDLQYEDLSLLCDLFYLPFEHGAQGLQILQEFNWLKSNAHLVALANLRKHTRATSGEDSPEVNITSFTRIKCNNFVNVNFIRFKNGENVQKN